MKLMWLREHPGGGFEVALVDEPGRRGLLWPRPAPAGAARAWVMASGTWQGRPAWLERRPPGALLSELSGLSAPEVALVLLDVADRLQDLHRAGTCHGRLDADHVVIDERGRAHLIGAGAGGDTPELDAALLRSLLLSEWPDDDPPDPGEGQALEVLSESLDGWLEYERPGHSNAGLGARSLEQEPRSPEPQEIEWTPDLVGAHADEVSYSLGPDTDVTGMFSDNTGLMDHTREVTQGLEPAGLDARQRLRAQARLMAPVFPALDPGEADGRSSQAILALLSTEPIDSLPLPDGLDAAELAPPEAPAASADAAAAPTAAELAPPEAGRGSTLRWVVIAAAIGVLGLALGLALN